MSESRTDCTICADLILDYIPNYFNGIEINPACHKCQGLTNKDASSVLSTNKDSTFVLPTNTATFQDSILDTNSQDQSNVSIDHSSTIRNMPSFETTKDQLRTEAPRLARSLFPPWKCEICEIMIPWPQTVEQALHMENHRKEGTLLLK